MSIRFRSLRKQISFLKCWQQKHGFLFICRVVTKKLRVDFFFMAFHRNFAEIPSLIEKDCIISAAVQEVFKQFEDSYLCQREITDDSLIALDSIFGETLEKALELVETASVKFLQINCPAVGVYQVQGSLHNSYIIFPNINYCPCLGYKYHVVGGSSIMCKHVLASIIARIIGKVEVIEIGTLQLHDILLTTVSVDE